MNSGRVLLIGGGGATGRAGDRLKRTQAQVNKMSRAVNQKMPNVVLGGPSLCVINTGRV
jgi:hypothetical protein